jgi:hypothetical protein
MASRASVAPAGLLDRRRLRALEMAPMPTAPGLLKGTRVIGCAGRYRVVYGPFYRPPNPRAEVIFVGLTPGYSQLALAARVVREHPELSPHQRGSTMRREVSFAGSMRRNLIAMLDELGLQHRLQLSSTADLFESAASRLFATSALLYPVFVVGKGGWKNYSGGPSIVREPLFIEMLETLLAPTIAKMPQALIIPFGKSAESGVKHLVQAGFVEARRVLGGFPHPSGGNGHRHKLFQANRRSLKRQLTHWFSP